MSAGDRRAGATTGGDRRRAALTSAGLALIQDPGGAVLFVLAVFVFLDLVVLFLVLLVTAEDRQRVDVAPGRRGGEQARHEPRGARRPPHRTDREREPGD